MSATYSGWVRLRSAPASELIPGAAVEHAGQRVALAEVAQVGLGDAPALDLLRQPRALQRDRRAGGQRAGRGDLLVGRAMAPCPVHPDRPERLAGPDRHDQQAPDERRAVEVLRDARVVVDVLDDGRLAVAHRPARDAVLQRKAAALPQRLDRVLVDVAALAAVAQDERRPVGVRQPPRGAVHEPLDVGARSRRCANSSIAVASVVSVSAPDAAARAPGGCGHVSMFARRRAGDLRIRRVGMAGRWRCVGSWRIPLRCTHSSQARPASSAGRSCAACSTTAARSARSSAIAGARATCRSTTCAWSCSWATCSTPSRWTAPGEGIDVAYYLVHSMGRGDGGDFEEREARSARAFAQMCAAAGVARVVYLGGLGDKPGSKHLRSRDATARTLKRARPAADVLPRRDGRRAGQRVLPHAAPPRGAPAGDDRAALAVDADPADRHRRRRLLPRRRPGVAASAGREVQIGSPDVLPYAEMLDRMAVALGRRHRPKIPVPLLTPWLSSLWIGLVTPVDAAVARPLDRGPVDGDRGDRSERRRAVRHRADRLRRVAAQGGGGGAG